MARKSDKYIQFQVRLENLKAGEAREVVKLLDSAHRNLINQLEKNGHTEWTRERLVAQIESYGKALDQVYDKQILPKLEDDSLDFVTDALSYHSETLVEQVTGTSAVDQKAAAAAKGYDVDNPVYRGSKEGNLTGQFFSPSKEYAEGYASGVFPSARAAGVELAEENYQKIAFSNLMERDAGANVGKFYLPKEGQISLAKDKKLAADFNEWFVEKKGGSLAAITSDLGEVKYSDRDYLIEYLEDKNIKWNVVYLDENTADSSHRLSFFTKDDDVAKSVYSDFTDGESTTAAAKAAAAENVGAAVISTNVSPAAIYTAANADPMQGKLMKEWATQLKRKELASISAVLKESWILGESTSGAVANLQPVFARSNRDLATITRTFYQHLASETQRKVWDDNSDLLDGLLWDATLDNRTTLEICAPRDQRKYTLKGEPIGHSFDWHGGPGQAHWNCRSIALPIIKGMKPTIERRAVSAGKEYERGDNVTRTGRIRKNTIDARSQGIYKDQRVSTKTTYESWLKRQPKAFQEDVLGIAKAKAFRSGDWRLGEKFTPQKPTTLKDF